MCPYDLDLRLTRSSILVLPTSRLSVISTFICFVPFFHIDTDCNIPHWGYSMNFELCSIICTHAIFWFQITASLSDEDAVYLQSWIRWGCGAFGAGVWSVLGRSSMYIRNRRGPRILPFTTTLLPVNKVVMHPRNNVRIQVQLLRFWH